MKVCVLLGYSKPNNFPGLIIKSCVAIFYSIYVVGDNFLIKSNIDVNNSSSLYVFDNVISF